VSHAAQARDTRALSSTEVLAGGTGHLHAVQFYEQDTYLHDAVASFLRPGLDRGDGVVVIATPEHREGIVRGIGEAAAKTAESAGRLLLLDASESLSRFMLADMPDPDLFRSFVSDIVAALRDPARPEAGVRAYGEMVDVLWRQGNANAAIRLEELWETARADHSFSLLCAYLMGSFYREGDAARFVDVCRKHTHVIPTERFSQLDDPGGQLREVTLLQQRARALETEIRDRKELEEALREALRERARVEAELRTSLRREKEARARAEASDTFKEIFLGILGHDLRNPLNTILTTARLMIARREVASETQRRVDRMITSGVRMERMIAQLLDLSRARLGGGIPVTPAPTDLVALVSKIVDETRLAHPSRALELHLEGPCQAMVDGDRFEQVISNLLGNAVAHGDERPIRVSIRTQGGHARIVVHNYGKAIAPAFMPMLFDPFQRERPEARSGGLGLGLYISERIVAAHGGTIDVESTAESGTRFEVTVPSAP
jgi:signal transduction histidine kinase